MWTSHRNGAPLFILKLFHITPPARTSSVHKGNSFGIRITCQAYRLQTMALRL